MLFSLSVLNVFELDRHRACICLTDYYDKGRGSPDLIIQLAMCWPGYELLVFGALYSEKVT